MKTISSQAGERNGNSKLTEEQVRIIKATTRHADTAVDLAKKFGVSRVTIHAIRQGTTWGNIEDVEKNTKKCPSCKQEKPLIKFTKDRNQKSGHRSRCKECIGEEQRRWRKTDAGKMNSQRGNMSIKGRYAQLKGGAKARGLEINLDISELEELISNSCHYCGGNLNEHGSGLDRMDNSKGYIKGNVVPCCKDCNTLKSNKFTYSEMMKISKVLKVINKDRLMMAIGVERGDISNEI